MNTYKMNVENKNDHDIIIPIKCECKSEIECKCKCGYQTNINNEYLNNDNNNKIIHTVSIIAGIIGMIGLICVYTPFSSIYSSQSQIARQPLSAVKIGGRLQSYWDCINLKNHRVRQDYGQAFKEEGRLLGTYAAAKRGHVCTVTYCNNPDPNAWRAGCYTSTFSAYPENLILID